MKTENKNSWVCSVLPSYSCAWGLVLSVIGISVSSLEKIDFPFAIDINCKQLLGWKWDFVFAFPSPQWDFILYECFGGAKCCKAFHAAHCPVVLICINCHLMKVKGSLMRVE